MKDLSKLKDEEIVKLVRDRDKEIYSEIIKRYEDKLMRYAVRLVGNEQKASDVVQESFIKAFVNLKGFNIKKKFSSWIYRIVHNEAVNEMKKYKREMPLFDNLKIADNDDQIEKISKKEIVKETKECLDKIPFKYAEPLILYYLEEKTYQEISDILRMPIGTVGVRIKRAKVLMKKICQKEKI